ncbi:hypothetical protein LG315_11925 [Microbacterium marinum]|uniref:hypothetical protein n=1 Tax=Microbacterium marinum TaxID=421115 RepID=UPI00384AD5E1
MKSSRLRFAIVGDGLLSAPSAVAINEGLNVLYGLNGAGKTRLLVGMQNALRGVKGVGVGLLVNLTDPKQPFPQDGPLARVAKALARSDDFEYHAPGSPLVDRRIGAERAGEVLARHLTGLLPQSGPARDWALRCRLFLFLPSGTPDSPGWDCWAVADADEDWAAQELAYLNRLWQEREASYIFPDEDEQAHDTQEERYSDALAAHTLLPEEEVAELVGDGFYPLAHGRVTSPEPIVISGVIDFGFDYVDDTRSVRDATSDYLRSCLDDRGGPWNVAHEGDEEVLAWERTAAIAARHISAESTERLRHAMLDGLYAELHLAPPSERLFNPPFEWQFSRDGGYRSVPLDALSRAERYWAERAIVEGSAELTSRSDQGERDRIHLYDEPESALHRAAEAHMASSLVERANKPGVFIIAATHSPELLDATDANLLEVERTNRKSIVRPLGEVSRRALNGLGLHPSDLLRLTRVFLVVEGLHDEVLLDHFLGQRFRAARVEIVPLHGGAKLSGTVDSRVLFDHTRAHVVGLLDNTDAAHVSGVWSAAQEIAATGHVAEAKEAILSRIGKANGESQYLSTWLTRALDNGLGARLTPVGLSKADVIEYLPADKVVPRAASWGDLRKQHAAALAGKSGTPRDFKKWLTAQHKVQFEVSDLLRYAEGVALPREFELLAKTIEAIAADRSQ